MKCVYIGPLQAHRKVYFTTLWKRRVQTTLDVSANSDQKKICPVNERDEKHTPQ